MRYIKKFEENKFKQGDIVYPKTEYTGKFKVLKPQAYRVQNIINQLGHQYLVLDDIDPIHMNQFPEYYFLTEFEYQTNAFNL